MTRGGKVALGAVAALLSAGVVLHLPFARSLLMWVEMRVGGCPAAGVSPEAVAAMRKVALEATRGQLPAPARPALGFTLDATGIDELRAWASAHRVDCEEQRSATLVKCRDVPASALDHAWTSGSIEEVAFGLDPVSRRVVAVTTLRRTPSAEDAAAGMTLVEKRLLSTLGAPTARAGDVSKAFLSAGPYRTATLRYAYRDYLASVTATAIPGRGVVVREEYLSARL